jgi:beta-glucosidase
MGYRSPNSASSIRWPFGYGLSYSTFEYKNLEVIVYDSMNSHSPLKSSRKTVHIAVDVQNTSDRAGYEVVQVYSQPPFHPMVWRPQSELIAFTKAWLEPDETRRIGLSVSQQDISGYWDSAAKCWRSLNGNYKISTRGCSVSLQIEDMGTWKGL